MDALASRATSCLTVTHRTHPERGRHSRLTRPTALGIELAATKARSGDEHIHEGGGRMVPGNQCFCGADGRATCLRCGQRRCATHYFLNVYPYGTGSGTFWAATTPRTTVELPFLRAWDEVAAKAYAAGDAACPKCRQTAAGLAPLWLVPLEKVCLVANVVCTTKE